MGNNLDIKDERWAHLKNMLDSYFSSDIANDDPLWERMETVKADNDAAYVTAVRADIADILRHHNDDLDNLYDTELRTYYWPGGDELTPRQWLSQLAEYLDRVPDTTRDFRSGLFG